MCLEILVVTSAVNEDFYCNNLRGIIISIHDFFSFTLHGKPDAICTD